jgi:hypothetical protein
VYWLLASKFELTIIKVMNEVFFYCSLAPSNVLYEPAVVGDYGVLRPATVAVTKLVARAGLSRAE